MSNDNIQRIHHHSTMSTSTKKKPSSSKTLLDKVVFAIRNQPPGPNGVSRTSITKYLQSEFDIDESKANQLKNAFKKGLEKVRLELQELVCLFEHFIIVCARIQLRIMYLKQGILVQTGQSVGRSHTRFTRGATN